MEQQKNIRQSNFEILRIIAAIMIVFHHYSLHGFYVLERSQNKLLGVFCALWGKVGVNIFVLISGYFLINQKFKIKKILSLIGQVYFYSILIMIINLVVDNNANITMIKQSLLPTNLWWFFNAYFIMYCVSPLINIIIKKAKLTYNVIIGLVFIYILLNIYSNVYLDVMYMYVIGAYIRISNFRFKRIWDKIILIIILTGILFYINLIAARENFLKINMMFLPLTLISLLLFICFKDCNIKNNCLINSLAKSSFAVYLLHDSNVFRNFIWKDIFQTQKFYYSNTLVL